MYNTTEQYKNVIRKSGREIMFSALFDASRQFTITKSEAGQFVRSWDCGQDLELGGVYSQRIELMLRNDTGQFDDVNFYGAVIQPQIGLKTGDTYEIIALGRFYVSSTVRPSVTMVIEAYDALLKLNQPYQTELSFPATLFQIAEDIAGQIGIRLAQTSFLNSGAVIPSRPDTGNITMRQVLGWIAQLAGSYVRLNTKEELEFVWFGETNTPNTAITYDQSMQMQIQEQTKPITGLLFQESVIGTEDRAVDISGNFLLEQMADKESILVSVFEKIKDTVYHPFTLQWIGDFSYQPGDSVVLADKSGKWYSTYLMQDTLTLSGSLRCSSGAKTKTEEQKGFVGEAGIKTAQLRNQIKQMEESVKDTRSDLAGAIEDTAQLMTRSMNCYTFIKDGENGWIRGQYISFVPESTADLTTEVWVQNANGFAHYPQGVCNPPDTGMTANGTLIAKLIAAGIVTADMVKTGILQSEDGRSWINLDTGELNFQNIFSILKGENGFYLTMNFSNGKNFDQTMEEITELEERVDYVMAEQEQLTADLSETTGGIVQEVIKDYVKSADLDEFQQTLSTQMQQTAEDLSFQFDHLNSSVTGIHDTVQNRFEELKKYIQFKDGNIILGEEGNELSLKITNNRILFLQNGYEVAYMSNNKLYITDAEILTSLKIGKFAFIPRKNGNTSFTWMG